jgi:hypothetical protein
VAVEWFLGDEKLSQEGIYVGKISSNVSKTSIKGFFKGFINFLSKNLILEVLVLISEIKVPREINSRTIKINFGSSDLEFHGSLIGG